MAFVAAASATNYLDLLDQLEIFANANGWATLAASEEAVSATVTSGGSGYTVGDNLTLVLGATGQIFSGQLFATFQVATEAAGVVLTVSLLNAGGYHQRPTGNPATPTTSSPGTGCTLNVTYQNTSTSLAGKRLILQGVGSGADEIFVGIDSFDSGGGVFMWQLRGFTGFQPGVDFFSQPGISPGSSLVPLSNGATTFWLFVTGRRIIGVFRMATTYTNLYMGFTNPFGTATDFPYPLLIMACSSQQVIFSNTLAGMSGMNDPIYHTTAGVPFGPGQIRTPGGLWKPLANSAGALSFRSIRREGGITPPGEDVFSQNKSRTWRDFIPLGTGAPLFTYRQVPDTTAASNFRFPLIPCFVWENSPQVQLHGEMDNVFWTGTLTELAGQANPEDVYNVNGDDYFLFPNCNRSDHWANFLIKKE